MKSSLILNFKGSYNTSFRGFNKLANFYHLAKQYSKENISLDFYEMKWFDANLSAVLAAMLYKLSIENRLTFSTDLQFIKDKFDVLIRNQFFINDGTIGDSEESTLPLMGFKPNEKDKFISCIDTLLNHRGLPKIDLHKQEKLKLDLIEILCNINLHARTSNPFFICGQYYPKLGYFILTITDLGVGFLPPINEFTKGTITSNKEAISWALLGNSSKSDHTPGGLGIKGIYEYCKTHNGIFNIITGDCCWGNNYEQTVYRGFVEIDYPFCGTTINLFFNWN